MKQTHSRSARGKLRWAWTLLALFAFAGCQSEDDGRLRLRMAHVYEVNAPTHAYGAARLSKQLRAGTDDLDVTVYPAAQLGGEADLLEQLVGGELDIAISGPSFLAMWHPPLGVFDAAYSSRDLDHLLELANSEDMSEHWDELRKQYNIRVLDTWAYGSRHITSNKPIRHPDDLNTFRLRMPAASTWQESGKALGASPMPISFSEVYLALQQGIADGQENPVPVIKAKGFHEVQEYINLTGHIQSSIQILMNEQSWQRLTSDQQQALMKTVKDLGRQVYEGLIADEKRLLDEWRENGEMKIVDDVDIDAFRAKAREHFSSGFEFSELYRQITAEPDDEISTKPSAVASNESLATQANAATDPRILSGVIFGLIILLLVTEWIVRCVLKKPFFSSERFLAAAFLFVIVSVMGAQVIARYCFGSPFPWSEEVARLALIWMTFIAASFVMAEGRHITVDVISHRLSDRGKLRVEIFSHAVVAGTCLLLAVGCSQFVYRVGKVGSPALGVPKSFWFGAVIVGLVLMAIHSINNLAQVIKTGRPLARETSAEDSGFRLEMEDSK